MTGCGQQSGDTTAKGTLEKIKQRDKIVIGVKTDYTPFGFIDKNGKNAGLEVDIANYIAKELLGSESKVEFVSVVAANRIEFLKQGKIDLVIATMTDTPERRKVIDFSENYYSAGTGLLTRKDSGIKSWDNLKGKKVCGIQGSFYNKELIERGIQMANFPGTAEAYKALQEGRCVGFAYDDSALIGKLLEPNWSKDWHQPLPPILPQGWGMGIRKGDTKFLESVNQTILKMEAAGFIVAAEKKWKIPATDYAKKRMAAAKQKSSK
ncbi:hypothetical protein IJ00_22900 [Calothrix sp. 336/3]|nr:hypothetical protein IJ00_22900 [Calothrix sp. 336/3]